MNIKRLLLAALTGFCLGLLITTVRECSSRTHSVKIEKSSSPELDASINEVQCDGKCEIKDDQ
jgi:hypothetical protein